MNISIFTRTRAAFIAAAVVSVVALAGCNIFNGDDDDDSGPILDDKLMNADRPPSNLNNVNVGVGWVDDYAPGSRDGIILYSDGSVSHISDYSSGGASWAFRGNGTWETSGNILKTTGGSTCYYVSPKEGYTYSLSSNGDTLYYGGEKLVKTDLSISGLAKAVVAGRELGGGAKNKPVKFRGI